MKLIDTILSQPRWAIFAEALFLMVIIGLVDFGTNWEFSVLIFYVAPILLATWAGDRREGVFFAFLCGAVWFSANFHSAPYVTSHGYIWAAINRTAYFIFVAIGGHAIKAQTEENRAKVEAMQRARNLEQEILRVSEHEQLRIGRDLHDGLCQNLAAIDCAVACLRTGLEERSPVDSGTAVLIQRMLQESIMEARHLARGLSPVQMIADGLPAALQTLVHTTNRLRQTSIQFETEGEIDLSDELVAINLYRIAQEALSNAVRHSQAEKISLKLFHEGGCLKMIVSDDGRGFDAGKLESKGMGLSTTRHRASLIGARFELETAVNKGTKIRCSVCSGSRSSLEAGPNGALQLTFTS